MAFRVVFFGLPLAALLLHRDGHDVVLASICRPDALGLRRLRRELPSDRLLVKPPLDEELSSRVRSLAPDLCVSWFWTTKLPMDLVRSARLGGVGVHPSLLPRHRGPDPTYWAIVSGDEETGVSAHRLEAEYDTGDVLDQERLTIDPAWDAWQLARALDRPSLRVLRRTVARLAAGEALIGRPQDDAVATAAPTPGDDELWIPWTWPVERIVRHVRALAPYPAAYTEIGGVQVAVIRAVRVDEFPRALAVGEGAWIDGRPVIRASDGAVALLSCRLEDEERLASPEELEALFA